MKAQPKPVSGSYSLVIQPRPANRWKVEGVPEFERNWIVRFNLPGRPVKAESSQVPVCSGCLAKRAAKDELPERCGRASTPHVCRAAAVDWADAKLRVMSGLWQADRIAELEQVLNPKQAARLTLQTVVDVYERCSLESRAKVIAAVRLFFAATTGKALDACYVDELTPQRLRLFVALYQEYGRKGWAVRGEAPPDAWQQLRALSPVPAIDWETPATWNTTAINVIARVKSMFGSDSKEKYIHELVDRLPDLREFHNCSLALPKPDNREAMTDRQHAELIKALPGLRAMDARMWLMVRLAMVTRLRSKELVSLQVPWIERAGEDVVLVMRNRRAEGAMLKDRKSRQVREIPLPADVLECIAQLTAEQSEGSVYGLRSAAQVDALYRRVNAWLRTGGYIAEDSDQVLYVIGRKTGATVLAREYGVQAAADALGHATAATTKGHYIEPTVRVKTFSPEQASRALTKARLPWKA